MKEKFWNFIDKNIIIIFFIIITAFSILIRSYFINFASNDYRNFLLDWFNSLKLGGGLFALKDTVGDYNAPYMTIMAILTYLQISPLHSIKIVSMIFDYVGALACMVLVFKLFKNHPKKNILGLLTYAVVIMLPTVVLNSVAWGQCDFIYVSFAIISLIFLIDQKYIRAFIFFGIAFAFKLQAIFFLPVYIFVYITNRKFSIYHFLILPVVNFVMCIPAMLFGKSFYSCISIYFNQMQTYKDYISLNFPGVYNIILNGDKIIHFKGEYLSKAGITFTLFVFAIVALILVYKKIKLKKEDIISLSLWSVMFATFFLPHMHDRYLFAADILSIIYFIIYRDKWYIPVGISFVSLSCYFMYLWDSTTISITYISILNLILLIIMTKDIYNLILKRENDVMEKE